MRSSVIDVFANYLGEMPSKLPEEAMDSLSAEQSRELIELLDDHLEAVSKGGFGDNAVLLDSSSDPVIFPNDPLQAMTTRRTKQVALYHHEVVIPIQPLFIDWDIAGPSQLIGLFHWCRSHEQLLDKHVLTFTARPNILLEIGEKQIKKIVKRLRQKFHSPASLARLGEIIGEVNLDSETIDSFLYSLIDDVYHSSNADVDLVYTDPSDFAFHQLVESELQGAVRRSDKKTTLLQQLNLPATDQLSNADFVAIRLQSEEFAQYRHVLGTTLEKTQLGVLNGLDLETAFEDSLDLCRKSIAELEGQIKAGSLKSRLRDQLQTMLISTGAGTAYPAWQALHGTTMQPQAMAVSALTGLILKLSLSRTCLEGQKRLLRFHKVLTDELAPAA